MQRLARQLRRQCGTVLKEAQKVFVQARGHD